MEDELLTLFLKFPSLTKEEVKAISENIIVRAVKKGTVLLKEGAVSKECYSVLKGCIRQYYIKEGDEKTTAFYTEGQSVSSFTSYINQTPSKHYLICVEDCSVTVGTKEKELQMITKFPKLAPIIRSEMEKNAGIAQEEMASFITSSPEERYLNLLENRPKLLNRVPQHQIASYLGMKPESLSRIRKRIVSKK
jgi:CRP-like cAMP-binding protein